MKIQPYISKLQNSTQYKEFQQKNKDAFLVAGFFVIDFESGRNVHQIDYYVPSKKKVAAFTVDKNVDLQLMSLLDKKVPEVLDMKTNIDLDVLKGIIEDEMKNRSITQGILKMIAVLQSVKGQKIWNVNCVLSGMDIVKVHVDDASETVLKMEKSSIMDYIKRVPGAGQQMQAQAQAQSGNPSQIQMQQPQTGAEQAQAQTQAQPRVMTAKDAKIAIESKIAQLDKIKEALKQEEVKIDKASASMSGKSPKSSNSSSKPTKKSKK